MTLENIKNVLRNVGYDKFKEYSSTRIAILTDKNRVEILNHITQIFKNSGARYDKSSFGLSSIGAVKFDNFVILAKPSSKQGVLSAGIENEHFLSKTINQYIKENGQINITFKGIENNKSYKIRNVVSSITVGTSQTEKGKKADLVITTDGNKKIPISLKKDNAEYWGSADTYWGQNAFDWVTKLLKRKQIELIKIGKIYQVRPNFAVKANREEKRSVVFGTDIENKGIVIQKTFSKDDFVFKENGTNLIINCTFLISDLSDVKGKHDVWFLIRADKTRRNPNLYPGLRVTASFEKRIVSTVLRVTQ